MSNFRCPKCHGHTFGTSNPKREIDTATGMCHTTGCRFIWNRCDDDTLGVFVPSVEELQATISELRESIKQAVMDLVLDQKKRTCYNVAHDLQTALGIEESGDELCQS